MIKKFALQLRDILFNPTTRHNEQVSSTKDLGPTIALSMNLVYVNCVEALCIDS